MSTITLYSFSGGIRGGPDDGGDTFTTFDYSEAQKRAVLYSMAVIANEYEWTDSELVDDNRPTTI